MNKFLLTVLLCAFCAPPSYAQTTPASGYWWDPSESGNGFVIETQGNQMFMAGFLYSSNGEATWVASVGAMMSSSQYSGPLVTYTGGQTLTGNYVVPSPTASLGTITINFTSDTQGSVTWPGGTFPIQRFDIVPGGSSTTQPATNPETGWWWNPNESGRGFAVEVQNGTMFLAGYMYDNAGNPIWYVATGTMTNAGLFQGEWQQFEGGLSLTGPYVAPTVGNPLVGTVSLQFTNAYTATLTLPNARQIPLIRFGFGVTPPVITGFSPAAGVPETQLTVNGSGFSSSGLITLTLSDSTGYGVTIPADSVSSTSIKVAVPPYIVASTAAFGSGTVSVQATQKASGVSLTSNSLRGFTIQSLPKTPGTAGNGTLALISADLAEAQKLQTSINGTAQATPAVTAALAEQVTNLQGLVNNIQSVVQNGASYSLGTVGGVDVTVTPANIGDVDSLIVAALQALANPGSGSALKTAAQTPAANCLGAEAAALAAAMTSGTGNLTQLAQSLLEAPQTDAACSTAAAFGNAFQILGGAADVGLGISNGAGGGVIGARLPGAALFAATTDNASTAVGLNALIAPALSTQAAAVQTAIASVTAQSNPTANQLVAKSTGALSIIVSTAQTVTSTATPQGIKSISGISIAGAPVMVFNHATDQVETNEYPDIASTAWRESDGTVNLLISHFEAYRMRGPDLEHLAPDPTKIYSSAASGSDIVEADYNYDNWLASPYTNDGVNLYALVHSEWYACLLNGNCQAGNNQINSWTNTVNLFTSTNGGAAWSPSGVGVNHVVANLGYYWTGTPALANQVYELAMDHSGLFQPSRVINEGNYYYSIGLLIQRDFSNINMTTGIAPVTNYGYLLFRTADITNAAGWQAWAGGSQFVPLASGAFKVFSPSMGGQNINAAPPQIIFDIPSNQYIMIFPEYGYPSSTSQGPLYFVTTPTLAAPQWSNAQIIAGSIGFGLNPNSATPTALCNTGFSYANYPSVIDTNSPGFNFEFSLGTPWLFYVVNPQVCGGSNTARDLYRVHLQINYQ